MSKERICPIKVETYLCKLCKIIFDEISNAKIHSDHFSKDNFSINVSSQKDRDNFEALIKTYIYQLIVNKGIEFLNKKNLTTENTEHMTKVQEFVKKFNYIPAKNINSNVNSNSNIYMNLNGNLNYDNINCNKKDNKNIKDALQNATETIAIKTPKAEKKQQIFLNRKISRNTAVDRNSTDTKTLHHPKDDNVDIIKSVNSSLNSNNISEAIFDTINASKENMNINYINNSSDTDNNSNSNVNPFPKYHLKNSAFSLYQNPFNKENSNNKNYNHSDNIAYNLIMKQNAVIKNLLGIFYKNKNNSNINININYDGNSSFVNSSTNSGVFYPQFAN